MQENKVNLKSQHVRIISLQIIGQHVRLQKMWVAYGKKSLFELNKTRGIGIIQICVPIFKDE